MSQAFNALNDATRALLENIKRAGFPPLHQQGVQMARAPVHLAALVHLRPDQAANVVAVESRAQRVTAG